jgi:hypothetical protein
MIFQPGQIIYDAAGKPPPADIKAAGGVAIVRYRCEENNATAWKLLTPAEWFGYRNADVPCFIVYELAPRSSLIPGNGLSAANLICDWIDSALGDAYPRDWLLLYAGGDFTMAGGMSANHIAKWDGTVWSTLDSPKGGGSAKP